MLDTLNVWATGYNTLYRSTDGGVSWSIVKVDDKIELMRGVQFLNSEVGSFMKYGKETPRSIMLQLTGGIPGINIQSITFSSFHRIIKSSLLIRDIYGLTTRAESGNRKIRLRAWKLFELDDAFYAFDFLDSSHGWAALWGGQHRKMAYTTDGGATWMEVDKPYSFQSEDVFIYEGSGIYTYVTGYEGSLIRFQRWDNFVSEFQLSLKIHYSALLLLEMVIHWISGQPEME